MTTRGGPRCPARGRGGGGRQFRAGPSGNHGCPKRWELGLLGVGSPRGAAAGEHLRWSAPVGQRSTLVAQCLWGLAEASGVCVEPLPAVRAACLPLRLQSPRLTPRWAGRQSETALTSTSWEWVGTEFWQAGAAADPERGQGVGPGLDRITQRGRTVLDPGPAAPVSSAPPALWMLRGLKAGSGRRSHAAAGPCNNL